MQRIITLSVVSHNQSELLKSLLETIDASGAGNYLKEIIITNNLPEDTQFHLESTTISVINNDYPLGFGANHNQAFQHASGKYFCVVNPDITITENPLPNLLMIDQIKDAGLVAPIVMGPDENCEDSLRYFPSLWGVLKRLLKVSDGRFPLKSSDELFDIEWAAGMFLLFNSEAFRRVGGFDEDFYLYYEDVDICLRLLQADRRVLACPEARVIHRPQRSSHKKLRFLYWHISSLLKYLQKHKALFKKPIVNSN